MMSKIVIYLLAIGLALSSQIDLKDELLKARNDIEAANVAQMVAGAKSSRMHRKKFTAESRVMAKRNSIFRKVVQNLEKDGLDHHEAVKMAQKAVRSTNGKHFQPDGHGSNLVRPITIVDDVCTQAPLTCDSNSNFRTIDGKCNNLQNPYWGAMSVAFSREIAVDTYDPKSKSILLDEDDEMITKMNRKKGKGSKGGNSGKKSCPKRGTLPSARFVSHTFHTSENISSTDATHMLTQWGQFLDHDLTLTPENEEHGCCEDNTADECFPILVPSNDSFYQSHSVNCLEFARSVAHCEENGGTRQQTNAITSFVDASNVYGSDNDTAVSLRSLVDGKLLIEDNELLPQVDGEEVAGDTRALEMPGLATMHTLFVREHNRLCDLIKAARPGWNDEEIYQNARRILIAEYQSITYGGFLPVVLGSKNMNNLKLSKKGSKYKPEVNPTMTNEFATASFRFGHSMIQGLIKLFHTDNSGQFDEYFLHENFFNMYTYRESMENILMGLITQPAQEFDKEITSETTNLLFPEEGHSFGSDLAARNIQRGRDHGLPGFCCYYKLYDDKKHNCKKGWGKKYRNISPKNWALLKTIYDHPKDIDLFTGLLAQKSHNGALGGKVIMKMKRNQFKRTKDGDRFFFTHNGQKGGFTKKAKKILIKRTLGGVICDNTAITAVPNDVFKCQSTANFVDCDKTTKLDDNIEELLTMW